MYIYLSFCKPARVYVSEQVHYDSKTHADKAARQYVSIYPRKDLLCLSCDVQSLISDCRKKRHSPEQDTTHSSSYLIAQADSWRTLLLGQLAPSCGQN